MPERSALAKSAVGVVYAVAAFYVVAVAGYFGIYVVFLPFKPLSTGAWNLFGFCFFASKVAALAATHVTALKYSRAFNVRFPSVLLAAMLLILVLYPYAGNYVARAVPTLDPGQ